MLVFHLIFGTNRIRRAGLPLLIECPSCHEMVEVQPVEHIEHVKLLHRWIIATSRSVRTQCPKCGRIVSTRSRLEALNAFDNSEPNRSFKPYVSFIGKFLTITTLVLFWAPFITPVLGGIAYFMTGSSRGWRRAAIIGLVLSSLLSIAMIAVLTFGQSH